MPKVLIELSESSFFLLPPLSRSRLYLRARRGLESIIIIHYPGWARAVIRGIERVVFFSTRGLNLEWGGLLMVFNVDGECDVFVWFWGFYSGEYVWKWCKTNMWSLEYLKFRKKLLRGLSRRQKKEACFFIWDLVFINFAWYQTMRNFMTLVYLICKPIWKRNFIF